MKPRISENKCLSLNNNFSGKIPREFFDALGWLYYILIIFKIQSRLCDSKILDSLLNGTTTGGLNGWTDVSGVKVNAFVVFIVGFDFNVDGKNSQMETLALLPFYF